MIKTDEAFVRGKAMTALSKYQLSRENGKENKSAIDLNVDERLP